MPRAARRPLPDQPLGRKRKVAQDRPAPENKGTQRFNFPRPIAQASPYPNISSQPAPCWSSSQAYTTTSTILPPPPSSFRQPSPWEQFNTSPWPFFNPQSPQNSIPSLTDGSTTAGASPASQQDGNPVSDSRSTAIGPFGTLAHWTSPLPNDPVTSLYSFDHHHDSHQNEQYHQAGHQPCLFPPGSFLPPPLGTNTTYQNQQPQHQQQHMPSQSQPWQLSSSRSSASIIQNTSTQLDCQTSAPCIDPSCVDGVPCHSSLLPPCDREDCPDGIPCADPHLPDPPEDIDMGYFFDHDQPDNLCCTDGCTDDCPPETRCLSPCFEEDCEIPRCDHDHQWSTPSACFKIHQHGWAAQQHACVDPRHTYHNHDHLPAPEIPFQSCHQEHRKHDPHPPPPAEKRTNRESSESAAQISGDETGPQPISKLIERRRARQHKNCEDGCAHKTKHARQHSPASSECSSAHPNKFVCKWVLKGDPEDPDAVICGADHANAADLQAHMGIHVSQIERDPVTKLFPCLWHGCTHHRGHQGFQARPKLKRHIMTHSGATPYRCDDCGRTMRTKDALDKHKRTHSGIRPFLCEIPGCSSRFATSTELKTHTTVHSGKKPHKCPICGEPFADSSNLSKHKKIHEVPKFKCPDCDFKMKRWDQMRRHFISQHHAVHLLHDKEAEKEYKHRMDMAFKMLTPAEREIPFDASERHGRGGRGNKTIRRSSSLSYCETSEAAL